VVGGIRGEAVTIDRAAPSLQEAVLPEREGGDPGADESIDLGRRHGQVASTAAHHALLQVWLGQPQHQLQAVVRPALLDQRTLVAVVLADLQTQEDKRDDHRDTADEAAERSKIRE
jgi:hypothetical protein